MAVSREVIFKTEVAIIGAGPYGLSLAAHLIEKNISMRIFGTPMEAWKEMPPRMMLKSAGFASSLSDPHDAFPLSVFCQQNSIPYRDTGIPVSLETFVAYGRAFQERFVRNLEKKNIISIDRAAGGFLLRASDGEGLIAKQVVIATGIGQFGFIPPELSNLPPNLLTHSVQVVDFKRFYGRNVIVIGAGASAMDTAAALQRLGATITVVARTPEVRFFPPIPARQNIIRNLLKPVNALGIGWKGVLCVKGPLLFHALPEALRVHVVREFLGPAPGWFVREELEGRVPFVLGATITGAQVENGRPQLKLRLRNEQTKCLSADHIVAATGFRVDVRRLNMLSGEMKNDLRCADHAPALTRDFESSIPGLYFVGTASANSFGPYMRFVAGAGFSSRRVSKRIAQRIELTSIACHTSAKAPTYGQLTKMRGD